MNDKIINATKFVATALERLLALAILIGLIIFCYQSIIGMLTWDWGTSEAFYQFIYTVLLAVIAVELIRTLVTHELIAILELIAFVVARKMLNPQISSEEILLCSLAFVSMLLAYKYLLPEPSKKTKKDTS